jgi:NitT/TauT family transport system substrate-binding protein
MHTTREREPDIGVSVPKVKSLASALAIGAVVSALGACGGGDVSGSAPSAEFPDGGPEITELSVGTLPISEVAPLYIAIEQGFFDDEGLTVTAQATQGGAAAIPALISGDLDVTFGQNVAFLTGVQQGLPLVSVGQTTAIGEDEPGNGVFVSASSPIQGPDDLASATIAVNTLNNITQLRTLIDLEDEGVDTAGVNFVEIALPDMPAALEAGRIQSSYSVEPFTTLITSAGARQVLDTVNEQLTGIPVGGFAVSREFAETNPNTVAAFQRAFTRGAEIAMDDSQAVRDVLSTYTSLTPELIEQVALPTYIAPDDTERMQDLADLMLEYGFVDEELDATPFVSAP